MKPVWSFRQRVVVDGTAGPIRSLRTMVEASLEERNVPEEAVRSVVLAFSEALDNAWEHGTEGTGEVDVRLRCTPRYVFISLTDSGSQQLPPGEITPVSEDSERGRGLMLMKKLMDVVHIQPLTTGGTKVAMLRLSREGG